MQLPHDEGVHASPLEWWYFNGHVATEGGRVFSYHFVTFQSVLADGFTPRLAQLSWADHDMDLHLIAEQPDLPILETTSGEFDLSIAGWRMSGDSQTYHLSFQIGDYSGGARGRFSEARRAPSRHRAGRPGHSRQDLLLLPHRPGDLGHGVGIRGLPSRDRGFLV